MTQTKDRRNLNSSTSKHVLPVCKEITPRVLEKRDHHAHLDGLNSGYGDPAQVEYMWQCRKSFYTCQKLLSSQATIESRVAKATGWHCFCFYYYFSTADTTQAVRRGASSPTPIPKKVFVSVP